MDRMIYTGMTGAKQTMQAQAANSHNLANANTAGFRADLHAFQPEEVRGPGFASRVNAVSEGQGVDFTPGTMQTTEHELDVAVQGQGWIAVQAPDGGEAYTRAGDLRLTANGNLVNGAGQPVMGDGGPIAIPPHDDMMIGGDGTISIVPQGQPPETMAVVERIKLVNPPLDEMEKSPDGLFRLADGGEAVADAEVELASGVLEGSNVNITTAMVNMIQLARQYETQVKMIQNADENAQAASNLLRTQ
ncbi:flagellar basal-body rod protein FlgF [Natronospira proteinivora]|uniref:Flagellar basal-body rod protein FlgF n=1 Tax=Natronospira proteinivora TaxID=1807133 RepID=A0ABT1G544_9GAMM|nr:flagellar basal-body rod protein FlgF [Natronospira proteinivora]MCP1726418.1 flagellar basal-body rod protein FlgF [Natronospira proteinivora]